MKAYRVVAVGGTFDSIHRGHRALLSKAFESGEKIFIGVVTDRFARTLRRETANPYSARAERLEAHLKATYPNREFHIEPLDDYFGPAVYTEEVEAIIVSPETLVRVEEANRVRAVRGLKPLTVILVDMVLADDDKSISSSRIRRGEIDVEGHLLRREPS